MDPTQDKAGRVVQVVECLPSKHKAGFKPQYHQQAAVSETQKNISKFKIQINK
jgi:hypothetical protein